MKTKTSWDLNLLYRGNNDPQIEKDLVNFEKTCENFEKKYQGKDFTKSPQTLVKALKDFESLKEVTSSYKPWWYFVLKTNLNSSDKESGAFATKNEQRLTQAANKVKFFNLEIAKIDQKSQKTFLKDKSLNRYQYFLKRVFDHSKYNLSEKEERLSNLLSQTSYAMWIDLTQRILNTKSIEHKGKKIPIVEAVMSLAERQKGDRRIINTKINEVLKSLGNVAEGEINAIYNYKKVMDERRGYKNPYSATILGNENDERSIESFIDLVSKNFKISQRFFKLHAKLIKEKKISVADRAVSIGSISKKFDFKTSVSIFQEVLRNFDEEYLDIFNSFLENGQIDVTPQKGKKGGAFCWGMNNLPTYVLLNHTNDLNSLETLAHEMGHAMHTEMIRKQPIMYRNYSSATAEVASTFFEQMVSEEIEKTLTKNEQIIMLHNKIKGDMSTIFRQIACFNFENELHQQIRKFGQVPKGDIANLMSKHLKSYLGNAVDVSHDDGYFFVYWSHIRRFFYVYTYAYGQLISKALYNKWKEDKSYAAKIKQFLKTGSSMSPEDIFKYIGIDTSKQSFFESGLRSIEEDIIKLEKLTAK